MAEQGSTLPALASQGEIRQDSIASQPLEPSTATTDPETSLSPSRRHSDSGSELPSSTQLPTASLGLDVNNLSQQLLDGLSLGGANIGNHSPATPRIDAALSRMVGLQALPSQPELTAASLTSHTAPASPVNLPPGVMLGGAPSLLEVPSPHPATAPASLLPSPNQPPAISMLPTMSMGIKDPGIPGFLSVSDNMLVHQQAMARAGMLPMPYAPPMLPRLSSVESMVEALQRLPRRESAVPHVAAHLYHLDKQGFAALLKMLGKAGLQHRAFEIFDWVIEQVDMYGVTSLAGLSDCYTYTTIISLAHGSREVCRRGMKYFADMRRRNVQPNVFTYTALMSVCMKANEVETVGDIYEDFCEAGFQPSVVTNKIAIEAYCRTRRWDKAYQAFARIEARDAMSVEPRIYVMVIMALGRTLTTPSPAECPAIALQLSEHLRDQSRFPKQVPMAIVYANMVTVFARVGLVDVAEQFFSLVAPQHLTKSAVSQIALAYQTVGLHERASMLLQQFSAAPPRPPVNPHNRAAAQSERNNICNSWQGTECFYELLHGECRYSASHHYGIAGGHHT